MDLPIWGSLHPDVEDRRREVMAPLYEAQLIMGQLLGNDTAAHGYAAHQPIPPLTPLAQQAGMLDIIPGHGNWLLKRKMAEDAAIQNDPNVHRFDEAIDPNAPPMHLDYRKR